MMHVVTTKKNKQTKFLFTGSQMEVILILKANDGVNYFWDYFWETSGSNRDINRLSLKI